MNAIAAALLIASGLPGLAPQPPAAATPKPAPETLAAKTAGMQKIDGFVPAYWDAREGKLFLEVARFDTEFLYQIALATGVGSNPIGLDRGQLGQSLVVTFRRVGPKVLLVESNYKYRAITDREPERRAVEESFAKSVHWGFKVEAEGENGVVLVDATAFFLRDAHGVADRLRVAKQGNYKLDESRSAFHLDRTRGFPKNTEIEAMLTFVNDADPGRLVQETAPSAGAISVRQHHSFVALPNLNSGFTPRKADPRVGVFSIDFYDYATPITEPVERRWTCRHRLIKKEPGAANSAPVEPIVYYVDPGAPEPVRSALVEGASWWAKAFDAAGFTNGFRVEVLPADADPMDLRYNVIQWVHRSTRGWSYGSSVVDPRTGEILKGRVTLDSLRARQDVLIGEGLVTACAAGAGPDAAYLADLDPAVEPASMVLARVRQLGAHEVGHTLGFAHNFAASTYGRASVMDYPAPLVKVKDGKLDLSDAYGVGIGPYDVFAVKYAYSQFAPGVEETNGLSSIVKKGLADGLLFLSDNDARPAGAANPKASLWDNGDDPVAALRHEMEVRRIGLASFGLGKLAEGQPLSALEAKFLPLYLHHRYQLQAALKVVGGLDYTHAVKENNASSPATAVAVIAAGRQRKALAAVLETLSWKNLHISDQVLGLIPPQAFGEGGGTAELFGKQTGPAFDPIAAATIAADLTITGLLQPERAARLIDHHARDPENPDFAEIVAGLDKAVFDPAAPAGGEIGGLDVAMARSIPYLFMSRLINLAANEDASPPVRAAATDGLNVIATRLTNAPLDSAIRDEIKRFLNRPDAPHRPSIPIPVPPGDPIGGAGR